MTDSVTRAQQLVDKLWADKSPTGAAVRKQAKELFPEITIPDEQAELAVAPLQAKLEKTEADLQKLLEKVSARDKADDDMRAESAMSMKLQSARKNFGLTDAGYDKMVERMKETGNFSDAEAAAAYVVSQMPKPAPSSSPSWLPEAANLFGTQQRDEQFEALHKDPRKYMDDQLREFARDPDAYVASTFGTN
ncbi:MAG TPA: hypothetical protein VGN16_09375 [Acidobacteriaceae bacterium]|jgi:hypothetical protein